MNVAAPAKRKVRIELPEKLATWEKTTGQDHFMHSLVLLQASTKIRHIIQMTLADAFAAGYRAADRDAANEAERKQVR